MQSKVKPIHWILSKQPFALFSLIFLLLWTLHWVFGFSNDRSLAIIIFILALFSAQRLGEKLRRVDAAAEGVRQKQAEWNTVAEQPQRVFEPVSNQNQPNWWG